MISSVLEMRRRSVWEAADSGILLWKNNIPYFALFFALPVAIAAVFLFFIPGEFRWVSWLGLWWLKPFFDRFCLQVLSVRFFSGSGEGRVNVRGQLRRIFRGLLGLLVFHLPGDLLWRRFSPFRASTMPLRLMERLKSKKYDQRKKSLAPGGLYFSALFSWLGLPLEAILLGGELIFTFAFIQLLAPNLGSIWNTDPEIVFLFQYVLYCVNYILVESLFVSMGFGVYINSRVEVEGWDIELLFKKFSASARTGAKILVAVTGLFLAVSLSADEAGPFDPDIIAETGESGDVVSGASDTPSGTIKKNYFPPDLMPLKSVPLNTLEEVLSSEDFGEKKPSWRIRLKDKQEAPVTMDINQIHPAWLKELQEILARGLRVFIVIILAAALVFVLVRLFQLRRSRRPFTAPDQALSINPLASQGEPDFFFDRAEFLFREGRIREAWAACFCGAINALTRYLGLVFPREVTEYGCLSLVRSRFSPDAFSAGTQIARGFGNLVHNWVLLAYGGRTPADGSFEEALEFGRGLKGAVPGGSGIEEPEAGSGD